MRRADGAGGNNHLAHRLDAQDGGLARELDAHCALAVEHHAMHQRVGDDLQIWPLFRRAEVGRGGAGAPAPAPGLLAPADRVSGATRQVVDVGPVFEAQLLRRLDDRMTGLWPLGHRRGGEVPLRAVNFGLVAGPPLGALEERQDVVPTPAAIAKLRPVVVILRLAADVDQPVDRRRAAEHAAARIGDGAAVRAGIGLGLEAPGELLVVKQLHIADRNMNERVPVAPAGLDQDHASGRVFGETVGQDASGRPGADDDVIRLHLRSFIRPTLPAVPSAVGRRGPNSTSQSRGFRGAF